MHRTVLNLLILLFAGACYAAPHKEIEVAAMNGPNGEAYSVALCARPSPGSIPTIPGHAFVGFSRTNAAGQRIYTAVGHTTTAGVASAILSYGGYLAPTNGYIGTEQFTHAEEQCLIINTDQSHYQSAWRMVSGYSKLSEADFANGEHVSLTYSLGADDCMALVIAIAQVFHPPVVIPNRKPGEFPMDYVRRVIDTN